MIQRVLFPFCCCHLRFVFPTSLSAMTPTTEPFNNIIVIRFVRLHHAHLNNLIYLLCNMNTYTTWKWRIVHCSCLEIRDMGATVSCRRVRPPTELLLLLLRLGISQQRRVAKQLTAHYVSELNSEQRAQSPPPVHFLSCYIGMVHYVLATSRCV